MALGLCSPIVVSASSVLFMNSVQEDEEEGVHLQISDLSLANGCLYMKLILLNGGIYLKLVPCFSMLILSLILLKQMEEGKENTSRSRSDKQ
ncbi:Protein CBG27145 [Caenorhabditis briggsae]|uniref:Protein CBG27145 n=1 Tax=Caenorhabditis briggsae TaxID=6238 RepID=B6IL55_CAEBR|nr:Protein CBG27145 [Caenorhabditis briggsae]CAS00608.1 Protein CBG27145 [Caenorhabditis briggsae]